MKQRRRGHYELELLPRYTGFSFLYHLFLFLWPPYTELYTFGRGFSSRKGAQITRRCTQNSIRLAEDSTLPKEPTPPSSRASTLISVFLISLLLLLPRKSPVICCKLHSFFVSRSQKRGRIVHRGQYNV